MKVHITAQQLEDAGAASERVEEFRKIHPDGYEVELRHLILARQEHIIGRHLLFTPRMYIEMGAEHIVLSDGRWWSWTTLGEETKGGPGTWEY